MEIKFRKAKLSDVGILNEFQNGIGIHERPLDVNIKRKGKIQYYANEDIVNSLKSKNSLVLIAELNKKPIGCGFAEIRKNHGSWSKFSHKGYIGLMFVREDYRGKGVGSLILKELLKWLRKMKIKDIRLQVYQNNAIAKNTYLKAGFKDYIIEMIYRPNSI